MSERLGEPALTLLYFDDALQPLSSCTGTTIRVEDMCTLGVGDEFTRCAFVRWFTKDEHAKNLARKQAPLLTVLKPC